MNIDIALKETTDINENRGHTNVETRDKVKVKVHNNRPRGHAWCTVYWKYISEKISQRTY